MAGSPSGVLAGCSVVRVVPSLPDSWLVNCSHLNETTLLQAGSRENRRVHHRHWPSSEWMKRLHPRALRAASRTKQIPKTRGMSTFFGPEM